MEKVVLKTKTLPLNKVKFNDPFWSYYINLVRDVLLEKSLFKEARWFIAWKKQTMVKIYINFYYLQDEV
jgi:hypothetical protein